MNLIFLILFLVIISGVQAISNQDFNMNFTSEDRSLNHSYDEQAHEFNGNLDGDGNIEVSTRLNHKVVIIESNINERKHELSVTIRRGGGFRGGGGRAAGGVGAGIIGAGVIGGSTANQGTHRSNNSATLLSARPHVYVSTFILCFSFWL